MQKLLYAFVAVIILAACVGNGKERAKIDVAQSIINERPDSALAILDSLEASSNQFSQSTLRRWQLLRLMAQNKCDTVFRSDSLQLVLTDYYDHHGSPNEKMWAHYLLGRAFADMGEIPEAIRAYQKAEESADTASRNCDFRTLCAILGQKAYIFNIQRMPKEQIDALRQYSYFAKKDGRIYDYIRGYEQQLPAWYALDDTARCFRLTNKCHRMYLENGMVQEAESVYPTAILILLLDSQYTKARPFMQAFENKSGLFDQNGDIQQGREHYYNSKGMYYNGVNQLDSAEYYFRKLAGYDIAFNYDAYIGLLEVYRKRGALDSITKYSILAERALDSIHTESEADALSLVISSYNYARKEEVAREKTMEAAKAWKLLTISTVLFVLTSIIICLLYMKRRKERREKQQELSRLESQFLDVSKKYEKTEDELKSLRTDKDRIVREKEEEKENLLLEIKKYKESINNLSRKEKESMLMDSPVVKKFHNAAFFTSSSQLPPNKTDWNDLMIIIRQCLPFFTSKVIDGGILGEQEQKVCILTRLGLHNGDVALLLDIKPQNVTNAKVRANLKLFGEEKASALYKNLKNVEKLFL